MQRATDRQRDIYKRHIQIIDVSNAADHRAKGQSFRAADFVRLANGRRVVDHGTQGSYNIERMNRLPEPRSATDQREKSRSRQLAKDGINVSIACAVIDHGWSKDC